MMLLPNKHHPIYTNDNINVTQINKHANFNDNNYFTKKIEHTSNITNHITRNAHKQLRA